jgi:hypothetical protein
LSKSFLQELKNNFSFFSCQARKPYSHKAFPRFHARETIGKNFAVSVKSGDDQPGKAKRRTAMWYVLEERTRTKAKRKGLGKERKEGRKEGKEGKESMLQEPIAIPH